MPSPSKKAVKKRKSGKLPDAVAYEPLVKSPVPEELTDIDGRIVKFCDDMMASEWQPCHARPRNEIQGCFVIGRWFEQQKTWAILYVGQGCIRDLLESRFRANHKWSIGMYLSSFPKKALRKLIWVKWYKDPYYPREVIRFEQLMPILADCYNGGEQPAFNLSLKELTPTEDVPEGFSLIPNYESKGFKPKVAKD